MTRFRTRRPAPQLIRATTIQKTSQEVGAHWWRYRYHYLEAMLARLVERQQGTTAADGSQLRSVVLLHDVPLDDRAVFERYVAQALAKAQAAAAKDADPDQVEADTLAALIAEAEGRTPDRGGWGFVPDANDRTYDVHPLPTSDPRTVATTTTRNRPPLRTLLLAGAVLLGGVLYSGVLLRGSFTTADAASPSTTAVAAASVAPSAAATPTPLQAVWDEPLDALRPTSLELVRDDAFVLPIDAVPGALGAAWTPPLQPGRAAWLEGSIVNLVVCLAPADAALITAAHAGDALTLRIANGETRQYVAQAPRVVGRQQREVLDQRRTGLTLIVCGTDGNDRHLLEATLADPAAPAGAGRTTTP